MLFIVLRSKVLAAPIGGCMLCLAAWSPLHPAPQLQRLYIQQFLHATQQLAHQLAAAGAEEPQLQTRSFCTHPNLHAP
jgi:hypothetical protein